ncbi:hypothetical protein, partial [Actinoplanes philippinensis]|uniref:hypothetical protein n=1 Tax=Actinoplanes philippinensis TaxID=35752 RepID=UPI0033FF43F1
AEREGHVAVWVNAHTLGELDASAAFSVIAESVLRALTQRGGSSKSPSFLRLDQERQELAENRSADRVDAKFIAGKLPDLNQALRAVLRPDVVRLYLFIDDFYFMPMESQPRLLHNVAGMLRDCDGWIKVASIERLTRSFEPSSRLGLEFPHDASQIDLDITLEDPDAAQNFLESVLSGYTASAGVKQLSSIAKSEALGRLVLASGGVPRDYLNLFASSIVVARQSRSQPQEIGREDVAKAAGISARSKKRDLSQDVHSERSDELLTALERLTGYVKKAGYTYFRVNMAEKGTGGYELLGQLVDMRFAHLVQASLSDQHKAGTKYEVYVLDLSEYTDVRLKRSLEILDLEDGKWTRRLSGKARTRRELSGTQFRDLLRQSPLVPVNPVILLGDIEEMPTRAESALGKKSSRVRKSDPNAPQKPVSDGLKNAILDLWKTHPSWNSAQIYGALRGARHDISRNVVDEVMKTHSITKSELQNVQLQLPVD